MQMTLHGKMNINQFAKISTEKKLYKICIQFREKK